MLDGGCNGKNISVFLFSYGISRRVDSKEAFLTSMFGDVVVDLWRLRMGKKGALQGVGDGVGLDVRLTFARLRERKAAMKVVVNRVCLTGLELHLG